MGKLKIYVAFYSETIIMSSRERLTGEFLRNTRKPQWRFAIADQNDLGIFPIVGTRDNRKIYFLDQVIAYRFGRRYNKSRNAASKSMLQATKRSWSMRIC